MANQSVLFEVSSEAARKIGGIYTVLRSKSSYLKEKYGENYYFIGYFDADRCEQAGFAEEPVPPEFERIFSELNHEGIICHYGLWTKGSNVKAILIDCKRFEEKAITYKHENWGMITDKHKNYIKYFYWENYGVDSLATDGDFTEYAVWGYTVGMLLEKIASLESFRSKQLVGQFHEWLAGGALLYLKAKKVPIASVFTTHATVLGRTINGFGRDTTSESFQNRGKAVLGNEDAYKYGVAAKHLFEKACANTAYVFTAVSETVAIECEYVLGKKPDVVTTNGFDFAWFERKSINDRLKPYVRDELLQFLESYFVPYYHQDYCDSLIVYISGRYEFRNKGYDLFIKALGIVNARLKGKANPKRIFGIIFAPSNIRGPRPTAISNYLLLDKIDETLESFEFKKECHNLQEKMDEVKSDDDLYTTIREMVRGLKKNGLEKPPISCFELNYNENDDSIIQACYSAGLSNAKEDVVKAIFYPTYISPGDGLLSMSYYDLIGGTDIGVFPSRYEPYGLTPVEAGAKENIVITTDTTGFGIFIEKYLGKNSGVTVAKLLGMDEDKTAEEIANEIERIYHLNRLEKEALKKAAFKSLLITDWKNMMVNYYAAYDLAVLKMKKSFA